ncbi:hypothetical protein EVB68_096 [Rhizobium phage RHph_Y2_6]|uniref:Uncharacterized protein n=1 Tax=Rhizobium phage RHph_Y2_6 TaxID=2509576 RepID=A0A7S5QZD8_9CAUD|nr:hypothetical protein PP748_gp100 [Rhizobium phage RHph_Y2_6]QIG68831.1 hypothetical protein EVB68_096 [Rhizobium phage RHph_Y2_6]
MIKVDDPKDQARLLDFLLMAALAAEREAAEAELNSKNRRYYATSISKAHQALLAEWQKD